MVTGLLTTSGMFSASQTELFCIQTIFGETEHFLSQRERAQLIFENSIYMKIDVIVKISTSFAEQENQ